jgi:flagellar basal-body rod protein FlgG
MAVQGNGYFQVTLPSGDTAYTRDGTFGLAADGTIVTADGYVVQPGIQIPSNATSVTVNQSGQVQVTLSGQTTPQTTGQLQLAVFPNDVAWRRRAAIFTWRPLPLGSPSLAIRPRPASVR